MKNRGRRRGHHNHLRNPIIWMGLIITPLLLLLLWNEAENLIKNFRSKSTAMQELLHVEDVNTPMLDMHHLMQEQMDDETSPRVYPYSVVNGGVHSVQELRSAIGRDPVVAKHYSNFKLDRARVIKAKADGDFHVSYRIGDEIFWTKKRLKVAKGEKLITDGTNFTRTRCANVLSEVIPGKTSPDEPTPEVLNTPTVPPSEATPFIPPAVIGGGRPGPLGGGGDGDGDSDGEGVFSGPGPGPGPLPGPGPGPGPLPGPLPVPEPATLLLFVSGLLGLAGYGGGKFFKK